MILMPLFFGSAHLTAPKAEVHSTRQGTILPQGAVPLLCLMLLLTLDDQEVLKRWRVKTTGAIYKQEDESW